MSQRSQRIIALLLVLSPWIYIPTSFKEVFIIVLGISLFLLTLDIRKKKRNDDFETKSVSFVESKPLL